MSINAFESSIGTRSTIAKAISADTDIRSSWISKIIEVYPEINLDWLFSGKGLPINEENNSNYQLDIERIIDVKLHKAFEGVQHTIGKMILADVERFISESRLEIEKTKG